MSRNKRYQVLIGLHESAVADARRHIGCLEQQYQIQDQGIQDISAEQAQAALHVTHLLHEQYVHYCAHLQRKAVDLEQRKHQISHDIETSWNELREAQRKLDVFQNLQQRQQEQDDVADKRREQRQAQDFALMKWLEASS